MTAIATSMGIMTRYMLTVKGHEGWVFNSAEGWRSDNWWDFNPNPVISKPPDKVPYSEYGGWIPIDCPVGRNLRQFEQVFFAEPYDIYKLLRACIRRNNYGGRYYVTGKQRLDPASQKEAWQWAKDNFKVYKIEIDLNTLDIDKTEIPWDTCTPKNITTV